MSEDSSISLLSAIIPLRARGPLLYLFQLAETSHHRLQQPVLHSTPRPEKLRTQIPPTPLTRSQSYLLAWQARSWCQQGDVCVCDTDTALQLRNSQAPLTPSISGARPVV
jgi:hypothetical protein